MKIYSNEEFLTRQTKHPIEVTFYLTIVGVMTCTNLIFWLFYRKITYLYFSLMVAIMFDSLLKQFGIHLYFNPKTLIASVVLSPAQSIVLGLLFAFMFVQSYLNLKNRQPRLYRLHLYIFCF